MDSVQALENVLWDVTFPNLGPLLATRDVTSHTAVTVNTVNTVNTVRLRMLLAATEAADGAVAGGAAVDKDSLVESK